MKHKLKSNMGYDILFTLILKSSLVIYQLENLNIQQSIRKASLFAAFIPSSSIKEFQAYMIKVFFESIIMIVF